MLVAIIQNLFGILILSLSLVYFIFQIYQFNERVISSHYMYFHSSTREEDDEEIDDNDHDVQRLIIVTQVQFSITLLTLNYSLVLVY